MLQVLEAKQHWFGTVTVNTIRLVQQNPAEIMVANEGVFRSVQCRASLEPKRVRRISVPTSSLIG